MQTERLLELAQEIEEHLRVARNIMHQPLETKIAKHGLTAPQLSVIRALIHSDLLTLRELSQQVGLAHSTVSGIVDRLEQRKMLKRVAHESDRRFTRIAISDGLRTYMQDKVRAETAYPLMKALKKARPEEQALVLNGLRTLRQLLQQLGA